MARAALSAEDMEVMRSRMAEAALQIYCQEGLEAISFRRMAEALGLSTMLAYRYFENKEALLARMRTQCLMDFDAHLRARLTHTEPMERFVDAGFGYVEYVQRNPEHYLLMFSTHQPPPEQYPELLMARRQLFEYMISLVQACVDVGQIRGDARRMTHVAWMGLHGLLTLQAANQLVYGCTMDELVRPLLESFVHDQAALAEVLDRRAGVPARAAKKISRKR